MIMREAVSMKSKIMPRLNSMLKRGKLASTAIGKVLQHRYSNLTCRSDDQVHLSIVSPGDYEFSCSNSPAYPFFHISKPRNRRGNKHVLHLKCNHGRHIEQIYINNGFMGRASPLTRLPGFGHSPEVRQLSVTDSPFSGDHDQVDKEAEEFIKRFYMELESQS